MIIGDKNIHNNVTSLHDKLSYEFKQDWDSITLCSAFLSESATNSLIELFDDLDNDRNLKVTIMIGVKNNFTSPSSIRKLLEYINISEKSNIKFNLILPLDNDFHIKTYVFMSEYESKAIVGSANLTDTGLKSRGELSIDINNEGVNDIMEYVNGYLKISKPWSDCIDKYEEIYKNNKSTIVTADINNFKVHDALIRFSKRKIKRLKINIPNDLESPTQDNLYEVTSDKSKEIDSLYDNVKYKYKNLIRVNSILFEGSIIEINEKYKVNSYLDRPKCTSDSWNIGDNRGICTIGAIEELSDDEVVIFMKGRSFYYNVTKEIIDKAEELGIKSIDDEESIPSKENMDKYIKFIRK